LYKKGFVISMSLRAFVIIRVTALKVWRSDGRRSA
jgi:hypothetical protein